MKSHNRLTYGLMFDWLSIWQLTLQPHDSLSAVSESEAYRCLSIQAFFFMMLTLYFHKHTSSAGCHGTGYAFAVSSLPFLGKRSHSCSSAAGRATPHHEWMGRYHRKIWPGKKSVEVSTEAVGSLCSKGKQGPKLITTLYANKACRQCRTACNATITLLGLFIKCCKMLQNWNFRNVKGGGKTNKKNKHCFVSRSSKNSPLLQFLHLCIYWGNVLVWV